MKFLLDTQISLWFVSRDGRLPAGWCDTIRRPENEIYLSVVSLWECIIKNNLGNYRYRNLLKHICLYNASGTASQICLLMKRVSGDSRHFPRFIAIRSTGC